jgi:hypothetical protein
MRDLVALQQTERLDARAADLHVAVGQGVQEDRQVRGAPHAADADDSGTLRNALGCEHLLIDAQCGGEVAAGDQGLGQFGATVGGDPFGPGRPAIHGRLDRRQRGRGADFCQPDDCGRADVVVPGFRFVAQRVEVRGVPALGQSVDQGHAPTSVGQADGLLNRRIGFVARVLL